MMPRRAMMPGFAMMPVTVPVSSNPRHVAGAAGLPRRATLLLLAALPAACSSPNPILYVLATAAGPVRRGAPRNIALRSISLARYLERSQIVRSSEGYRLDVLSNEWWGEPLDALIDRILVQELTQRLPDSTVFADTGAISTAPDATVEVNIQRFDLDRTGALLLLAQIAVGGKATGSRGVSVAVPPTGKTTSALVAAMSNAIGQLADAIAALLAPEVTPSSGSSTTSPPSSHRGKHHRLPHPA
jgi:uncharacterized protein